MTGRNWNVVVVVGTRPEIIKMAPVIRALNNREGVTPTIVHTDQHYDDNLSADFFTVLELPDPVAHLGVGSGDHAEQTADGLATIDQFLHDQDQDPAAVLAQGDTNTVLSTALAASKHSTPFGHIEAGIRSFDWSMPEEINRTLADQAADLLFAPTETAADNLAAEGIHDDVVTTGNTIVDACRDHVDLATKKSTILTQHTLEPDAYVVATIHRERNTDDLDRLQTIVETLDDQPFPVVFPAHPRTKAALEELHWTADGSLQILDPLDYLDFLCLLSSARVVVTDSGGIQEEAAVLEVPCLTVRPNTERPETIEAGVNQLTTPADLNHRLTSTYENPDPMTGHPDLYGDGSAGDHIVDALTNYLARQ